MARIDEPITIKRYANRRLYHPGSGTYVTLEDLAEMVEDDEDFVVFDVATSTDITRSVLKQIIIERADHG
jgi:polyhydroxyalkanoate synthesis repressor PhaR